MDKAPDAFRTISEVADELDLPQHVLRFWESRFREIKPMKRGGGRRYYRPDDVDLLRGIRHLLYGEGYTIRGVQRILREQGAKFVAVVWQAGAPQPPHGASEDADLRRGGGFRNRDARRRKRAARPARRASSAVTSASARTRAKRGGSRRSRARRYRASSRPTGRSMRRMCRRQAGRAGAWSAALYLRALPARLAREDMRKLHAALHELAECRKLIAAAAQPE